MPSPSVQERTKLRIGGKGANSNFFSWRKEVGAHMQKSFGNVAKFVNRISLEKAVRYGLPEIVEADYNPQ